MKSKSWFKNIEKGQVLPIVVISLFALIAMAALMIDGGMLLSHRRTAQAAADAGALAGAESLCPGGPGQGQAIVAAEDYVARNQADVMSISFPASNTIRVETSVSSQAFFARIFGQLGLTAEAVAEANCTYVSAAQVLPLGFPCYPRDYIIEECEVGEECDDEYPLYDTYVSDSENCYLKFGEREIEGVNDIDKWNLDNNKMVLIFTSDKEDDWCMPDGPINCADDKRQSILAGNSNNGWISLNGLTGFNNLKYLMANPDESWATKGLWVFGEGGKMDSLYPPGNNPLEKLVGKEVTVPLFNEFCRGDPQNHCSPPTMDPGKMRTGDTVICKNNNYQADGKCTGQGVGDLYYRLDAFAAFKITCVRKGHQQTCPYQLKLTTDGVLVGIDDNFWKTMNSIEGYFLESEIPYGGGGGINVGLVVVQLTK